MFSVLASVALAALLAMPARVADPPRYAGTVVRVVDGNSVIVSVAARASTPFDPISVRMAGIDTPESRKPPAKCKVEVALGKAASAYAKELLHPGDAMTITLRGIDKFDGRIDADILMPDGRDFATVMLASCKAFPYAGKTKRSYCQRRLRSREQDLTAIWCLLAGLIGLIIGNSTGARSPPSR